MNSTLDRTQGNSLYILPSNIREHCTPAESRMFTAHQTAGWVVVARCSTVEQPNAATLADFGEAGWAYANGRLILGHLRHQLIVAAVSCNVPTTFFRSDTKVVRYSTLDEWRRSEDYAYLLRTWPDA
jgi:hypothetical protein